MSPSPETRPSLLLRLVDRADQEAWREFAQIYTPVVYRLALSKGLQHADAEDQAQQVLAAVSADPTTIDRVLATSNLPTPQVLSTLTVLEMRRLVKRLGGNLVMRV